MLTTPYESMSSMIGDVEANGGSWTPRDRSTATPQQTISGVSNLFLLNGQMEMRIQVPDGLIKAGSSNPFTWTFAACVVDSSCGSTVVQTAVYANSWMDMVPVCPTMSFDITHTGDATNFVNPFGAMVAGPSKDTVTFCQINVGRFNLVVNGQTGGGGGTISSPVITTPTATSVASTLPTSSNAVGNTGQSTTLATSSPLNSNSRSSSGTSTGNSTTNSIAGLDQANLPQASVTLDSSSNGNSNSGSGPSGGQSQSERSSNSHSNLGVIIGASLGAVAIIIFLVFMVWWVRRKRRIRQQRELESVQAEKRRIDGERQVGAANRNHDRSSRQVGISQVGSPSGNTDVTLAPVILGAVRGGDIVALRTAGKGTLDSRPRRQNSQRSDESSLSPISPHSRQPSSADHSIIPPSTSSGGRSRPLSPTSSTGSTTLLLNRHTNYHHPHLHPRNVKLAYAPVRRRTHRHGAHGAHGTSMDRAQSQSPQTLPSYTSDRGEAESPPLYYSNPTRFLSLHMSSEPESDQRTLHSVASNPFESTSQSNPFESIDTDIYPTTHALSYPYSYTQASNLDRTLASEP